MLNFKRFKKRLKVQFSDGQKAARGFTKEIAEDSMYVLCRKPLSRGDWLELDIEMDDGAMARCKARVLNSQKQVSGVGESGMEIELTLYNKAFARLVGSIVGGLKGNDLSLLAKPGDFPGDPEEDAPAEASVIEPPAMEEPKPEPEPAPEPKPEPEPEQQPVKETTFIIMECEFCGTKNKVPEDKLFEGPICAMCKEKLLSTS